MTVDAEYDLVVIRGQMNLFGAKVQEIVAS